MLPDHDGYSEDYLENTELNRGIFLSFNLADQFIKILLCLTPFILNK